MAEQSCKQCGTPFQVRAEEEDFLKRIAPRLNGSEYAIPLPTRCPTCRRHRRLAWRNERHLYRRRCDATGKTLISNVAPDSPFRVFDKSYWFSDNWDALNYGRSFDYTKTFADNFRRLQVEVPRFSIQQQEPMENSLYCNYASNCQNSYFLFDSDFCRDSYYCYVLKRSHDCCDCDFTSDSELCWETVNCKNCYNLRFSQNCQNCSDSVFLESCIGCKHCAFCTNLRNKEYCFRNEQLPPDSYRQKVAELGLERRSTYPDLIRQFREFISRHPRRYCQAANTEHATGDYIFNSKNVHQCFNVEEVWDAAYCDNLYRARNCADVSSFGEQIDFIYETTTAGLNTRNCAFCFTAVVGSHDLLYCDTAYACGNCLGCVSIHRKNWCILNKQYSKEDYEKESAKIIRHMVDTGEWGEFFPISVSPFAYNESVANDYFPLNSEDASALGYAWRKDDQDDYKPADCAAPDVIADAPHDITEAILACSSCRKNYRLTKAEYALYRRQALPPPEKCPDCRQKERMARRRPRELFDRTCDGCATILATTYSPRSMEAVLCEACYQRAVN